MANTHDKHLGRQLGSSAANETVTSLEGGLNEPRLLIRHRAGPGPSLIYVHGATFPSALSIAYRFDGRSWMDDLCAHGFDVWAFDFSGFGGSQRPKEFAHDPQSAPPYGRTAAAVDELARVVAHVTAEYGKERVSLLAHSRGTMVAGLYATRHPNKIGKLAFFAPIATRHLPGLPAPDSLGAWQLMTIAAQHKRFIEDVPPGHAPLLIEPDLDLWGPAYLATDPDGARCTAGPVVKIPTGAQADILAAWSGDLPYDPAAIEAPVLIVRGAWDSLTKDADAAFLLDRLASKDKRDVIVPEATHRMHLEHGREGLFAATGAFLAD
jgi:pimeloyl-ACP methyl ester carboxylesterase